MRVCMDYARIFYFQPAYSCVFSRKVRTILPVDNFHLIKFKKGRHERNY